MCINVYELKDVYILVIVRINVIFIFLIAFDTFFIKIQTKLLYFIHNALFILS